MKAIAVGDDEPHHRVWSGCSLLHLAGYDSSSCPFQDGERLCDSCICCAHGCKRHMFRREPDDPSILLMMISDGSVKVASDHRECEKNLGEGGKFGAGFMSQWTKINIVDC